MPTVARFGDLDAERFDTNSLRSFGPELVTPEMRGAAPACHWLLTRESEAVRVVRHSRRRTCL